MYKVQFFVDDKEIKTFRDVKGTEENYVMSETEYGDGGYGVKVRGFFLISFCCGLGDTEANIIIQIDFILLDLNFF